MRLLTLITHIEKAGDVAYFSDLATALSLEEDDLEQYIIDGRLIYTSYKYFRAE